jgi:hypothetical protein
MKALSPEDLYVKIHKGLRKALFDLALAAGKTDYNQSVEVKALQHQFEEVVEFLHRHSILEETHILPVLKSKAPDLALSDSRKYSRAESQLDILEYSLQVIQYSPDEKTTLGRRFYMDLCDFVATYLVYMQEEETVTTKALATMCMPNELENIYENMLNQSSTKERALILKYVLPSVDTPERENLIRGFSSAVPTEAFASLLSQGS